MSDQTGFRCVLLHCAVDEAWAIPQDCLAEVVTLPTESDQPPEEINWRGRRVAVLDFDDEGRAPWREARGGTGLIAIILGLAGRGCDYWGVALRGPGLRLQEIPGNAFEDRPDLAVPRALGAFRWQGATYQVPDLPGLQEQVAGCGQA